MDYVIYYANHHLIFVHTDIFCLHWLLICLYIYLHMYNSSSFQYFMLSASSSVGRLVHLFTMVYCLPASSFKILPGERTHIICSLLSSFLKNTRRLRRSPCCLCVCVPPPPNVPSQWLGKHNPAVMNIQATIEEMLEAVFPMWSMSYQILNMKLKEVSY
jgi:hypothetical protein